MTLLDPGRPELRPNLAEPVWRRAARTIAHAVDTGRLAPGSRLPSERELCGELGVSRVTLRKALLSLEDDGMLSVHQGRGWFVGGAPTRVPPAPARADWPNSLESFTETAARLGLDAASRVIRAEIVPATLDEAERLQIVAGTPLLQLDRIRSLGGIPILRDRSRFAASVLPDGVEVDFTRHSVYALLSEAGLTPARADTTIEARGADAELARELRIEPGSPVLVMHELVHAADRRPVLTSEIDYAGERYRLRTVFARTPAD